jgi:beta-lactamase regulating signal transducer with metallopeptidase domain
MYYIWLLVLLRLALPLSFDGSIMNRIIPETVITQTPVVSAPNNRQCNTDARRDHTSRQRAKHRVRNASGHRRVWPGLDST